MKKDVLKAKSLAFALRIVKAYKYLSAEKREWVMSKQLLRSGTSIGANVTEAGQAESRKDFTHKLSIANKEAFESEYWIILLRDAEFLTEKQAQSLIFDCNEIQRILVTSIQTTKRAQKRN